MLLDGYVAKIEDGCSEEESRKVRDSQWFDGNMCQWDCSAKPTLRCTSRCLPCNIRASQTGNGGSAGGMTDHLPPLRLL